MVFKNALALIGIASTATLLTLTSGVVPSSDPFTSSSVTAASTPPSAPLGWNRIFTENFNTSAPLGSFTNATPDNPTLKSPASYATTWKAYPSNWRDTSKYGVCNPTETLSVHNGVLDIYLHAEDGQPVTAALMPVLPVMTYGRYSVRIRSDTIPGYKTAFLLWPDSELWPSDGEIDFPEGNLDGHDTLHAYLHYALPSGGQDTYDSHAAYNTWHTATIEWTPGKVTYLLDGRTIGISTRHIPTRPMHWVLQTETQTNGSPPPPDSSGHIQIDWVSVYTVK